MSAIQATDEVFDPFVVIHQSVTARLQTVEAELETAENKSRELEASLEQVREQAEESRVVEKHLLNNLKQFSPAEVQETFANIRETQLSVERVQFEYETLAARRAELKDQGQFLRSASQILADLQRMYGDSGGRPTPGDGDKQFRCITPGLPDHRRGADAHRARHARRTRSVDGQPGASGGDPGATSRPQSQAAGDGA